MPDYLTMMRYYHEYQEAETRFRRISDRLKLLREKPLYVSDDDRPAVYAEIEAVETEYAAAQKEVDELWCRANTGMSKTELEQSRTIRPQGLQPKPHFPEAPRGGKLSH